MIRFLLVSTFLSLAAVASADPVVAACDPQRIGARDLADCLRSASDKSDKDLAAALEAAQKGIDAKPGILATRKTRWKRFLADTQSQWASFRDQECQDLAPLEAQSTLGDPRLACLIDHNVKRAGDLRSRYP